MLTPDSIRARLEAEAQAQGLEILHACESGSRAWGLASTDSDYDVRFVYRRPLGRYLEMQRPVDVIGPVLEGELDFAGWDLPKFAAHLVRSNPSVLEWLGSPQFYLHDKGFLDQARDLANRYFDVRRAVHYVGIGQSAWDGGPPGRRRGT
ncbi:MAG: nucleotidyltransferase domain-containing protein [Planctomycetota bacterium]